MLETKTNYKVVYISSTTRAGSTLLDMFLANQDFSQSMGEINKITKPLIFQEYCSCHSKISECEYWGKVLEDWTQNMENSYEEFVRLKHRYERIKGFLFLLWNLLFPSPLFETYCRDTRLLFDLAAHHSSASILIDSSKVPLRILLLRKIFGSELRVIHLIRDFSGVLNSAKKARSKNVLEGMEYEKKAGKSLPIFLGWFYVNVSIKLFSAGTDKIIINYEDILNNHDYVYKTAFTDWKVSLLKKEEIIIKPKHVFAGNRNRMKKELRIFSKAETMDQLNKLDFVLVRMSRIFKWIF